MENKQPKTHERWATTAGVALVIIAIFTIGYLVIQKFGNPADQSHEVRITVPEPNSKIFVDGEQVQVTDKTDERVEIKDLKPGIHTIIVAKDGFWPWSKEVEFENINVNIYAFLIPIDSPATTLKPEDPKYASILKLFSPAVIPNVDSKLVSSDERVQLWIENNKIMAEWVSTDNPEDFFCRKNKCDNIVEILKPQSPITSISFYKTRSDVILFSTSKSIYAVEVDKDGNQNFQPVYEGIHPVLAPTEEEFIYVKDGASILKIYL